MDLRLPEATATDEERDAVDALVGAPASAWDGGERGAERDAHLAIGGHERRARRHLLLPVLQAVQSRVGWISEGALGYVCERLDVAPADAWGVATFYALLSTSPRPKRVVHVCDDIACRCRGAKELCEALEQRVGPAHAHAPAGDHTVIDDGAAIWLRSPCLGMCDHAPAAFLQEAGPRCMERLLGAVTVERIAQELARGSDAEGGGRVMVDGNGRGKLKSGGAPRPATASFTADESDRAPIPQLGDPSLRLLRRVGVVDPTSIEAYRAAGGYEALRRAFELGPDGVVREMIASKLMGRGGAAFPTGKKWEAVAHNAARPHYLICNADESEPGTFKDRVLLSGDPFAVVEAMTIAGIATGCEVGYLYIRGEYPLATRRMSDAIAQARMHGFLGDDVLGHGVRFDIEIRRGGGAYICGEETAIFNSIEGYRGEPRNKPPFPVNAGLFGKPTVVNNVETLVNALPIVLEGGDAFARIGTAQSTGTKLFCLCGTVQRPGVYEVPLGTSLRTLIEMAGGVPRGRRMESILMGGAAGGFIRADEIDVPLSFEGARAAKTTLGSGVVMLVDDSVDLPDLLLRLAAFFRDESCGQCVPCRVGTVRQEEALHRLAHRTPRGSVKAELALLDEIGVAMRDASICGLGQTAYAAVESAIVRLGLFGGGDGKVDMRDGGSPTGRYEGVGGDDKRGNGGKR